MACTISVHDGSSLFYADILLSYFVLIPDLFSHQDLGVFQGLVGCGGRAVERRTVNRGDGGFET